MQRTGSINESDLAKNARAKLLFHSARPDTRHHDPSPDYLRGLLLLAGLSPNKAAATMGIGERTLFHYLTENDTSRHVAPYLVQYGLERLAHENLVKTQSVQPPGHCQICGVELPPLRDGRGRARKLCGSVECKAEYARRKARESYHRHKEERKAKQVQHYQQLKTRRQTDPEYSEAWHAYMREQARKAREKRDSDPVLRQRYLEEERERQRLRREKAQKDPQKLAAYNQYFRERRRKSPVRPRGECEVCGTLIPPTRHVSAKTCSNECAVELKRRYGRTYYAKLDEQTRREYKQRSRNRERERAAERRKTHVTTPEERKRKAEYMRVYTQKIKSDPEKLGAYREKVRERNRRAALKRKATK